MTVGIPAYSRPTELRRALNSVLNQGYPNLSVIVRDDASPGDSIRQVVQEFRDRTPCITYHRNPVNVGLIANTLKITDDAQGEYFMWVADDDELTPTLISQLVDELERHNEAVTAVGQWLLVDEYGRQSVQVTRTYPGRRAIARAARYMLRSDDAMFYGLHRLSALRQIKYVPFLRPNVRSVRNWCYVVDFDLVLQGRVVASADSEASYVNHDYTSKLYEAPGASVGDRMKTVLRRVDLQRIYCAKARDCLGPWTLTFLIPVAGVALILELVRWFLRWPRRILRFWRRMVATN